jgi:hypothetical protein
MLSVFYIPYVLNKAMSKLEKTAALYTLAYKETRGKLFVIVG